MTCMLTGQLPFSDSQNADSSSIGVQHGQCKQLRSFLEPSSIRNAEECKPYTTGKNLICSSSSWELGPRALAPVGFPESCSYQAVPIPRPNPMKVIVPEPWWKGELAEGIHNTLRNREKMMDILKLVSPQLQKRVNVVDFMSHICKCLPFSNTTRHLAILLLDHFMEKHSIMDYRLKLVALTCLLVAAKMEDRDDYLPSIKHLKTLAKLNDRAEYSCENFKKMELYLMKFYNWSISYPTAAHFIGYYNANCQLDELENDNLFLLDFPLCLEGISGTEPAEDATSDLDLINMELACGDCDLSEMKTDFNVQCKQRDSSSLQNQLEEITASLLEKALRDYRFLKFPSSLVAAAAVSVARIYLKTSLIWTPRLENVSYYTEENLRPAIEIFLFD